MARYQRVLWRHESADEPNVLYSEIEAGYETRKVEVYRDGRHDFADRGRSTGSTFLGLVLTPNIDELNEEPEFSASSISAEEFEQIWRMATHAGRTEGR